MTKVTVTLEFPSAEVAAEYLHRKAVSSPPVTQIETAQAQTTPPPQSLPVAQPEQQAPASSIMPGATVAPQATVVTPQATTVAPQANGGAEIDVDGWRQKARDAVQVFLGKGGGRNAAGVKAILSENGVTAIKDANLQQAQKIFEALQTR